MVHQPLTFRHRSNAILAIRYEGALLVGGLQPCGTQMFLEVSFARHRPFPSSIVIKRVIASILKPIRRVAGRRRNEKKFVLPALGRYPRSCTTCRFPSVCITLEVPPLPAEYPRQLVANPMRA
jgi:hypothetical protein